jgi:hypothetical protein
LPESQRIATEKTSGIRATPRLYVTQRTILRPKVPGRVALFCLASLSISRSPASWNSVAPGHRYAYQPVVIGPGASTTLPPRQTTPQMWEPGFEIK